MKTLFNRNHPVVGPHIGPSSQDAIENSLTLRQASIEDALRFGGSITRRAIEAMELRGDRKYMVVDTKVGYLMPGFYPAIPGWHTDGVPRGDDLNPGGKGEAKMSAQNDADELGITSSHYHLLVTGEISQTEFINQPLALDVPDGRDLYKVMTELVTEYNEAPERQSNPVVFSAPADTVVQWDWWNIHRAVPANAFGWRYLIRVTETDYISPRSEGFLRHQNQVYVPVEFGW